MKKRISRIKKAASRMVKRSGAPKKSAAPKVNKTRARKAPEKIQKGKTAGKPKEEVLAAGVGQAGKVSAASVAHEEIGEKFSTPSRSFAPAMTEIPYSYGVDNLVLMVRDPWWLFSYWEVTSGKLEEIKGVLGDNFSKSETVLRVYDISNISFDGTNAHNYFDIPVGMDARNWYLNVPGDGRSWCVDLGLRGPHGFYTILRSNPVSCPSASPSWITDEEYYSPWDDFLKMYAASVGERGTSPVGKEILKKRFEEMFPSGMFSGVFASGAVSSQISKKEKKRKFFLEVWTELIVYGRTEADASVTVQGRPIALRGDGTFSLRFFLPDGEQIIPVAATSSDKIDTITITPIVSKETK